MTTATRSKRLQLVVALVTAVLLTACQSASPLPSAERSSGASASALPTPFSSAAPSSEEVGHWEAAGTMATARVQPHAIGLADGRVLVIGDDMGAEIWDPATGEWRTTASLNNPRTDFAAVALADGRVLVTGGLNDINQSYSSAYAYDPRPGRESWTKVGLMDTARTNPSAALLPDGRVLVAGGYFRVEPNYGRDPTDATLAAYRVGTASESPPAGPGFADIAPPNVGAALATAELFDPATGTWSLTSPLNFARYGAPTVTLTDGRILVVGSAGSGYGSVTVDGRAHDSAELYDPETGRFTVAGTLPEIDWAALEAAGGGPRPPEGLQADRNGILVALQDGGALLVDHSAVWRHFGAITRSFRFDAESESWHEVNQPYARWSDFETGEEYETPGVPRFNPMVARLADGRVIIAGGHGSFQTSALTNTSADIYDPVTNSWSPLPPMPAARAGGAAVALTDGSVLFVGGYVWQALDAGGQQEALASAVRFVTSP
jgi:hypothetical protein